MSPSGAPPLTAQIQMSNLGEIRGVKLNLSRDQADKLAEAKGVPRLSFFFRGKYEIMTK